MNGSAPPRTSKLERGTSAAEICVVIPHEVGVRLLVQTVAAPPTGREEPQSGTGAVPIVWRRHTGNPVVHAYAVNSCVDVPLCGSSFKTIGSSTELPPPPMDLGPYRRCRKCVKAVGRRA